MNTNLRQLPVILRQKHSFWGRQLPTKYVANSQENVPNRP